MNRRDQDFYEEYRALQTHGWDVQKENQVRFNSGSETNPHFVAKCLAARVGHSEGYSVASEVVHPENGEIDILLWNHPERLTYAVETETSPTDEVIADKLERYVHSNPVIDDLLLVNVNNLPVDRIEAEEWIRGELGL